MKLTHLNELAKIPNRHADPLQYVLEKKLFVDEGLWLEFGVYSGRTINYISQFSKRTVYGFDSFEGLPEEWIRSDGGFKKGFFSTQGKLPKVNSNVQLIKGWFDVTLPLFIKEHPDPVYFLHVDCDIYSSTKTIFDALGHLLAPKCIIVFDELINYPDFDQHEWKAWWEFVDTNQIQFEWMGMNGEIQENFIIDRAQSEQKVALKIIHNPIFKR